MARRQIYAVYRGEENLGDGTADELAKKTGQTPKNDTKHERTKRCVAREIK